MSGHRTSRFFCRRSRSKLRNQFVSYDGHRFASKLEAAVYLHLKNRALHGEIELLKTQVRVKLTEANIVYIPDFMCRDLKTNEIFFVEAKGFQTPDWKIKKKLWAHYGPAPLEIWHGNYMRPTLSETLRPTSRSEENSKQNLFRQKAETPSRDTSVCALKCSQFSDVIPAGKKG